MSKPCRNCKDPTVHGWLCRDCFRLAIMAPLLVELVRAAVAHFIR